MGSVTSDAEVAVLAALAGAEVVRARYGAELRRVDDSGVDFTTEADVEAERAIRAVLAELRPADGIVGEELGPVGSSRRRWLVDPICGTLNFAARVPVFAVNVALEVDGDTAAATVIDPVAGHVFLTDGERAWHRAVATAQDAATGRPLTPTASSRLLSINLESTYPDSLGMRLLSDGPLRARFSPRIFSSTLGLAWVATGQQAGYITGGDLRGSVHWTAGIALCEAAGAVITNLAGGTLHTGEHGLVAAADAETHEFVLARLNSLP